MTAIERARPEAEPLAAKRKAPNSICTGRNVNQLGDEPRHQAICYRITCTCDARATRSREVDAAVRFRR
jgi:hypothetical protein